jgi:hypothetical protein
MVPSRGDFSGSLAMNSIRRVTTLAALLAVSFPFAAHAEGETCEVKCAAVREEGIYEIVDGQGQPSTCCCIEITENVLEPRPAEQCVEE